MVPASIYLALLAGKPGIHRWGTVMATDTAFAIGCLSLFGRRLPPSLRLFLLSLAIVDEVDAIVIVALGYGDSIAGSSLIAAAFGVAMVITTARMGIRSISLYWVLGLAV